MLASETKGFVNSFLVSHQSAKLLIAVSLLATSPLVQVVPHSLCHGSTLCSVNREANTDMKVEQRLKRLEMALGA